MKQIRQAQTVMDTTLSSSLAATCDCGCVVGGGITLRNHWYIKDRDTMNLKIIMHSVPKFVIRKRHNARVQWITDDGPFR